MKTKNIIIFGGIILVGIVGYVILNKKKSMSSADKRRQLSRTKPQRVTASINPAIFQQQNNFTGQSIV